MNTLELWNIGDYIFGNEQFVGVYPLNKMPPLSTLKNFTSMIINTETHNLPGQHWLAVFVCPLSIHTFDPLSVYYPALLVSYLERDPMRKVVYNRIQRQDPGKPTCGQHCILWLVDMSEQHKNSLIGC